MKSILKICLIAFFFTVLGCVTTKPNIPYQGPLSDNFNKLAQRNSLLATEIRKLPELRDGISSSEATTLDNIVKLYHSNPDAFDRTFEEMYQVGKQDVRLYCSPLQALFWMVDDGKGSDLSPLLNKYYLFDLLEKAWDFGNEHEGKGISLTESKAQEVLAGLNLNEAEKGRLTYSEGGVRKVNRPILLYTFFENPKIFSEKSRMIMREGSTRYNSRWSFAATTSRLNSPELIDYFTKNYFVHQQYESFDMGSASLAFKEKGGNCVQIEAFQRYCLNKSGYPATREIVESKSSWARSHVITKFFVAAEMFVMDNGTSSPKGIIGPCEYIKECGYTLYR